MKQICVISGKGGTGKTSITACLKCGTPYGIAHKFEIKKQ